MFEIEYKKKNKKIKIKNGCQSTHIYHVYEL